MKIHLYLSVILGILISSCSTRTVTNPDLDLSHKIRIQNHKTLAKNGFYYRNPSGIFPQPTNRIWDMYTTNKYKFTSINEARMCFCKLFEEYVKPFNETLNTPPDFHQTPASHKNIELTLIFCDSEGQSLLKPYINEVRNDCGYIVYTVFNVPEKRMDIIHKETFETGYNIYLQTKNAKCQS